MDRFGLRCLELFFKDKSTVILSLLAEIIIMILYIIFIRDNLLDRFYTIENIEIIMDSWMLAGIIGITPLTAAMGAYGVMISDKAGQINRDFNTSPMRPAAKINGYIFSAAASGIILSFMVLIMAEVYLMVTYDTVAAAGKMIHVYMLILFNSITSSAIVILPVSYLKSSSALSSCCTIIGSLIGFLTGIYLPIGSLDQTVQTIIRSFPISHTIVLFRQELTCGFVDDAMAKDMALTFREYMGIEFLADGEVVPACISLLIPAVTGLICVLFVYAKGRSQ